MSSDIFYFGLYILLLATLCLFIKSIVDIIRKKKVRKMLTITGLVCAGLGAWIIVAWIILNSIIIEKNFEEQSIPMVNLAGYDYNECKWVMPHSHASYFDMEVDKEVYSDEYPEGTVISHSPSEGSLIVVGDTTVSCVVSKGSEPDTEDTTETSPVTDT